MQPMLAMVPRAVLTARALLEKPTPLHRDCGRLCGGACCEGDDETGMLLFPGEETLYAGCAFARVVPANYALAGRPALLLVCRGKCPRAERPLACRLFPLFLAFDKSGGTRLIADPRARGVCPLCGLGLSALDPAFVSAARAAFDALLADDACRAFLEALDETFGLWG